MPEVLILCAVLLLVALLGHGLWLLFAAVVRMIFGAGDEAERERNQSAQRVKKPTDNLAELRSQIYRLVSSGQIDDAAAQRLTKALDAEIRATRVAAAARLMTTPAREIADPNEVPIEAYLVEPEHAQQPTVVPLAVDPDFLLQAAHQNPPRVPTKHSEVALPEILLAGIVEPDEADKDQTSDQRPDVSWRAEQYAARRAAAALLPEEAPALPKAKPRAAMSELLSAFMEQRNIRWGELVGGLLIVCCSIALVISFWAQIAERPFLKFVVFNGVVAALFGIGLYTQRRWKLETTSAGVLIIATLLVPLNFLAIAAFSGGDVPLNAITLGGEILSTILFGSLIYLGGRVLIKGGERLLTLGILVPSLLTLLVRRFISPESGDAVLLLLAVAVLAIYGGVNLLFLARVRRIESLDESQTNLLFKLLGMTTFATLLPLGLILFKAGPHHGTMQTLAPLLTLMGTPAMAVGALVWSRVRSIQLSNLRLAGTTVGVLGVVLSLAAMPVAWPQPGNMLIGAALNGLLMIGIAVGLRISLAHVPAAACLLTAGWLAVLLVTGQIGFSDETPTTLIAALLSSRSAVLLVPLSVVPALVAAWFARAGQRPQSLIYAAAAAVVGAISIAIVSCHGLGVHGDSSGAVFVYAIYAVAMFAAAGLIRNVYITWAALVLLQGTLVQGLVYTFAADHTLANPLLIAIMVGSIFGTLLTIMTTNRYHWHAVFAEPTRVFAVGASLAAAMLITWHITDTSAALLTVYVGLLTLIWLAVALASRWQPVFSIFQLGLIITVGSATMAWLESQPWYQSLRYPWIDPRSLQAIGIALTGLAIVWLLIRNWLSMPTNVSSSSVEANPEGYIVADRSWTANWRLDGRRLLRESLPPLDNLLATAGVALVAAMSIYSALPGAARELSPRNADYSVVGRLVPPAAEFALPHVSHEHAGDVGSWTMLVAVLILLILSQIYTHRDWKLFSIVGVTAAGMPLWAAHFESQVAVASALRWISALYLLVCSALLWSRGWIAPTLSRVGIIRSGDARLVAPLRFSILALSLAPLVLMAIYVMAAAVSRSSLPAGAQTLWLGSAVLCVVMSCAASLSSGINSLARQEFSGSTLMQRARTLLFVLGASPLIAVTAYVVTAALKQNPLLGPEPSSIFAQLGLPISYAVPAVLIAVSLIGYALRDRSATFAWSAGLVLNLAATVGYLLSLRPGTVFDAEVAMRLVHINAAVAATYALAWMGIVRWFGQRDSIDMSAQSSVRHKLLITHATFALALHVSTLLIVLAWLFIDPRNVTAAQFAGSRWGWLSFAAALISWGWITGAWTTSRIRAVPLPVVVVVSALLLAAMIVCSIAYWDTGDWLAYHALLAMLVVASWLCYTLSFRIGRSHRVAETIQSDEQAVGVASGRRTFVAWSTGVACLAIVASVRASVGPGFPWWTVGSSLAIAALFAALSVRTGKSGFLHAAAILILFAANCWWTDALKTGIFAWASWGTFAADMMARLQINIIALAAPAAIWMWLDSRIRDRKSTLQVIAPEVTAQLVTAEIVTEQFGKAQTGVARRVVATKIPSLPWPMHRLAAVISLVVMMMIIGLGLHADYIERPLANAGPLPWLALIATTSAVAACLWDRAARFSVAGLYVLIALALGLILDQINVGPRQLVFTGTIMLAAFCFGTSYLWSRRTGLLALADSLQIPRKSEDQEADLSWLLPTNCLLAIAVVALAILIQCTFDEWQLRILAAQAAIVQAFAVGLLARGARRTQLQYLSLAIGVAGAVALSWSFLTPGSDAILINRLVAALAALALMTVVYGIGLTKVFRAENEWTWAAQRLAPVLVAASLLTIAGTLAFEVNEYIKDGTVPISSTAIAVIAVALLGLFAACLAAALIPGRDPFRLSERGRTAYVYAAEGLLALLFMHIRLTMPWLFMGVFQQFWPLIVVAIAFLGVGLGEYFRRKQRLVLADPLERTGALLPILPVLGFWMMPGSVHFSVVLLAIGGLYGVMAVTRRSFGFSLLAALCANGGLWYLLNGVHGFGILEHPQVWLIPPALCLLIAAYLNRDQLTEAQLTSIRYIASIVIYVSSTADIFVTGVANAPWLPMVLTGLSLIGIFAGIMMQVRSFLFLGIAFLLLSLFTVIWYAAVDLEQTWIWAVSGIVTGVAIIAVFAAFEKKRSEVLKLVDGLKHWKA